MRTFLLLLVLALITSIPAGPAQASSDGLEDVPMDGLRDAMRAWDGLAQVWFRLRAGDADGARVDARRLLRERPRDADALHMLGIASVASGRSLQGEMALRRSLRLRPDGWVGVQLVTLYLDAGRIGPAERLVSDLERTLAMNIEVRRARAYVLVAKNEFEGARGALESLERVQPTAEVAHQLAVLLTELNQPVEALAAARRAAERSPDSGSLRRDLFERLMAAGDWQGLVDASSAAGASTAGGGLDSYYRGVGLARLGRTAEAVTALSQVREHGDAAAVSLGAAAGYLLQLGAYDASESAARSAIRVHEDPALHHLLAMVLSRQGRESEGLAHYRRASEARPTDAGYRFDLLVSLCSLGLGAELDDGLLHAQRDFPEDPRFEALSGRCVIPPSS